MNFASPQPSHEHAGAVTGSLIFNYVFPTIAISKILEKKFQYVGSEMMVFILFLLFSLCLFKFCTLSIYYYFATTEKCKLFSKERQAKPPGL